MSSPPASRSATVRAPQMTLVVELTASTPVSFETHTVAYAWSDIFAAAASNFNLSLTVLAFLFPWRQMFTPTHRDFRLAPVCASCSSQQQEKQQAPAAHGVQAHSDAEPESHLNADAAPLELGKAAHPPSRSDSAAQPASQAHSSQLRERLLA